MSALTRPTSRHDRIEDLLGNISLFSCGSDEEVLSAIATVAPDYIVHTACSYGRAGESPVDIFDANVRFGLLLLEGAKRLDKPVAFVNTGTILEATVSSYAMSKQSFSALGSLLVGQCEHLKFVNVALQHMYGPGDDKSKFTTHIISSCLDNVDRLRLASGVQRRDFVYIDDVVSAYDAILSGIARLASAEQIEVGSGQAFPVRDFVELVHRMTASLTQLEFGAVPYRANEAMLFQADTSRLRSLGWLPETSLEEGIKKTIDKDTSL